jgi:ubiquinone biosynthesis protein Coq4
MADKKFIKGFIKEIQTQYWNLFNISLNLEQLKELPVDKYGNIKLTMMKRKEVWQYNDTHYMIENNYQWWWQQQEQQSKDEEEMESDLPF